MVTYKSKRKVDWPFIGKLYLCVLIGLVAGLALYTWADAPMDDEPVRWSNE